VRWLFFNWLKSLEIFTHTIKYLRYTMQTNYIPIFIHNL
jgi:hypothetical protein